MAETSKPWPKPIGDSSKGTPWDGALHRELWGAALGDGVLGDLTGQSLAVSLVGTTATLQPGRASVRGHRYINDAAKAFTIPAVSGSGNTRIDRVVLHYDPTQTTPATMIQAKLITGTAAASPVPPTLTRAEGTGWMLPVCGWRRTATGVDQPVDLRSWLGPQLTIADPAALPDDAPLGTTAVDQASSGRWWRQLVSGTPTWVSDTPRASAYLASTIEPLSGTRTSRVSMAQEGPLLGGMTMPDSQQIVVPYAGRYRIEVQLEVAAAAGTPANRVTSVVLADGGSVSAGYGYIDPTIGNLTISHVRPAVNLAAGAVLTWNITTSAGGGVVIAGGAAFTNICIQKVG